MTEKKKTPDQLRSARWFAPDDLRAFGHRSRAMQMGYAPEEWKDRPVIAILDAALGVALSNDAAVATAVGLSVIAVLAVEPPAGRLWYARNTLGPVG